MTTVLVVEDEPHIRANLVDLLELEGFTAVTAASGPEGLAALRHARPDLVLCDVQLPGYDGFALLELAQKEPGLAATPFVFLSAHAVAPELERGKRLGAAAYLTKPYSAARLLEAIRENLATAPTSPPPRFGSYRALDLLGQGGMGAVYVGEHTLIGKKVAIKVLLPQLSAGRDNVQRFFHEARAAAALRDPGIVDVFDFGYGAGGDAYLVMELLTGESLRAHLTREPRPAPDFVRSIGRQIARAMAAAHAQHIVHRDLKPDNVFLASDPELPLGVRAKVLDFGAAKLGLEHDPPGFVTRSGALIGTPLYMAPEQCRGLGEIDERADIYALGCVLFELCTGRPPFVGGGVGLIVASHIYEPAPDPRTLAPELPDALAELIVRCLAKDPAARPQTMRELAEQLSP